MRGGLYSKLDTHTHTYTHIQTHAHAHTHTWISSTNSNVHPTLLCSPLTCTSTRFVQMQVWPLLRWLLDTTAVTAFSTSAHGSRAAGLLAWAPTGGGFRTRQAGTGEGGGGGGGCTAGGAQARRSTSRDGCTAATLGTDHSTALSNSWKEPFVMYTVSTSKS